MTVLSVRVNKEEENLLKQYAKINNISISQLLRDSAIEKIEDEYDVSLADEAYKEYVDNGCKSQPIDELWNELGIH